MLVWETLNRSGCGRPLTCRMRKTLCNVERVDMGKRARVLVEGLKGSTELLEGPKVLKRTKIRGWGL